MKLLDRWGIITTILSVLLAVLIGTAAHISIADGQIGLKTTLEAVESGLLVGYSTFIAGFILKCWLMIGSNEEKIDKVQSSVDQHATFSALISKIVQSHDVIKNVGIRTLTSQMSSIINRDRGFEITGTNWAMRANTNFWRALVDFVKLQPSGVHGTVQCLVVHSGDPHIWKGHEAFASLEEQKIFSSFSRVKRIIVGKHDHSTIQTELREVRSMETREIMLDKPMNNGSEPAPKEYAELMEIMSKYDIETYYARGDLEDYGSDFALLKIENSKSIVMEWLNTHTFGPVYQCIFHEREDDEFENKWKALHARAYSRAELLGLPPHKMTVGPTGRANTLYPVVNSNVENEEPTLSD